MYGAALISVACLSVLVQGFSPWSLAALATLLIVALTSRLLVSFEQIAIGANAPIAIAVALFGLWLVVSAGLSDLQTLANLALYQQLLLPLAFAAYFLLPDRERFWRRFSIAAAILSVVLVAGVIVEPLVARYPSYSALFVQRNSLSGYLILLSFLLVPHLQRALVHASRQRALALSVVIFANLFIVSFSTSRAAICALVVGWASFYALLGDSSRQRIGKVLVAVALWAFLCADLAQKGGVLDAMQTVPALTSELAFFEQMQGPAGAFETDEAVLFDLSEMARSKIASANERWIIWRGVTQMLETLPWHGYGPGTFRVVYPSHALPEDRSARMYAHNDYLQIYSELGLPGVVLVAALGGLLCIQWLELRRRRCALSSADDESCALLAGVLALAAQSVFTYNFYVPATLVMFGLMLARLTARSVGEPRKWLLRPARHVRRSVFNFVLIGLAAVPVLVLGSAAAMSVYYERGVSRLVAGELTGADTALRRAAMLSDNDKVEVARAQLYVAAFDATTDLADKAAYYQNAEQALARAEAMNRFSAEVPYTRLMLAVRDSTADAARRAAAMRAAFTETLRRDQRYYPVRLELARLLIDGGELGAARGVLEDGLRHPFDEHPLVYDYVAELRDLRARLGDASGARAAEIQLKRLRRIWGEV